jgi:hypothetical protein
MLDGTGALAPLAGPAMLVTAVAEDTRGLRRTLDAGIDALGDPWSTASSGDRHPASPPEGSSTTGMERST